MKRMRRLVTAVAVAASMALALPGSAAAQDAPQVNHEYDFQLPSIASPFVPGRDCGFGPFISIGVVPGHASTDSVGTTTFSQTFRFAGNESAPNLGSSTVWWFNLASFQGGVASFPIADRQTPYPATSGGEVSVRTGSGQIVALMQPDVSVDGAHCNWWLSLGTFLA